MKSLKPLATATLITLMAPMAQGLVLQELPGPYQAGPPTLPGDITILNETNDTADWLDSYSQDTSSGTIYFAFEIEALAFGNGNNAGDSFGGVHLFDDDGGTDRLLVGDNWGAQAWSRGGNTGDGDLATSNPSLPDPYERIVLNDRKNIVVRIDFNANADDNIQIWLDPLANTAEGSQPASLVTSFDANVRFDSVLVRTGSSPEGSQYEISDVIFATTFSEVAPVPEPGSLALLAVGSVMALRRRKKS